MTRPSPRPLWSPDLCWWAETPVKSPSPPHAFLSGWCSQASELHFLGNEIVRNLYWSPKEAGSLRAKLPVGAPHTAIETHQTVIPEPTEQCSRHIIWKREPFGKILPLHPSFGHDTQRTSFDLRDNAPCVLSLCEC